MNDLLANRLEAIRQALMAHHLGGRGLPNDSIGEERQFLIDHYLREVLPPIYRFGSGVIVDPQGTLTGALDVVMELPFAPNFPMPGGGNQRLYLAESVAVVLEVKSDLYKQWDQAKATISKVRALRRDLRETFTLALESSSSPMLRVEDRRVLPCYVISYTGHKTAQALANLLDGTEAQSRPDGVLIIDSGAFVGISGQAEGTSGMFRLIVELVNQTNAVLGIVHPDLQVYL